jgi:hypothetical protein
VARDDRTTARRLPAAPLVVTLLVAVIGAGYWLRHFSRQANTLGDLRSPEPNALRVATWDIDAAGAARSGSGEDLAGAVARSLARLSAHVVALSGARDRSQVERVAAGLGSHWTFEAVSANADGSGACLALLADTRAGPLVQALVQPTSGRQALAFEIGGGTATVQVVCAQAVGDDERACSAYLDALFGWCKRRTMHGGRVTVLAGKLCGGADQRNERLQQFQVIRPPPQREGEAPASGALYVYPHSTTLLRAVALQPRSAAPATPITIIDVPR